MFEIGDGRVVDFWSAGSGPADYGVAVATAAQSSDYVGGGVSAAIPEPGSLWLLAGGLLGLLLLGAGAQEPPERLARPKRL